MFHVNKSDHIVESAPNTKALQVNPKLVKVFRYVDFLVKIASPISELNSTAKVVVGVVDILVSKCLDFINRHGPVLKLLEEVGKLIKIIKHWDNSGNKRYLRIAHQRSVTGTIREIANDHQERLKVVMDQLQAAEKLDGQVAVFETLEIVSDFSIRSTLKDSFGSKVVNVGSDQDWITCTEKTRVGVLHQIEEWALAPVSKSTLLLHGSPGKGKSTILRTITVDQNFIPINAWPQCHFSHSIARGYRDYLGSLKGRLDDLSTLPMNDLIKMLLLDGLSSITEGQPIIFTIGRS
ncbi:hypothetical protein HGRIS_003268 [Hohenbuehelia grisea]|uniref:Uncharacterized protein n=1 Tax=Hohenbuehelia grisea TaxID=104357 RepID=A0ABR3JQ39_9AGAR